MYLDAVIGGQELFGGRIRGWSFPAPGELVFEVARRGGGDFDLDEFTAELDRRRLPWAWVTGDGNERLENALGAVKTAGLG